MLTNVKFNLPDKYNEQQLISELADYYSIKKERSIAESLGIYDTFDWRLFNNSLVLYESTNRLFLRKLYENVILQSTQITFPPVFIWNFPDSKLKELLAPIIKVRALLKLVEIYFRSTLYHILNQDEKTVARLVYEEIRPSRDKHAPALATYFWLKPVRGYPKYSSKLAKRLREAGFTANKKEDIYFKALEVVDKKPGSYSSKLQIQLDSNLRSDEATKIVLQFLLQVIRINEANIAKDLDTEFLHDFRVAIRRTRSALGQIKNVFAAETTDRFKKDFTFVGKLSNQLRDLDVYLLNEDTYKAILPAVLRDDIDPLFDYLREKRSKVLQEVITGLKSRKYAKIMQNWEDFLNEPLPDSPMASNANRPIIDLARKRIYEKYRNVVKAGTLILENTEDKMLHVLRIECKKLRYLMEFFSSLFPHKKITVLVEQLKKLQDKLGDFNDLCVQVEYLLNITEKLPITDQQSKKALVAIGSLIRTLDKKKQTLKDACAKAFTDFALPANKKLFRELLALKKKKAVA
ncbi:MAG: CHAD domain-containing protein [Thermodesulfobacteriota bacterium]|nr:CHAD domain-containing protein [Thermodesulfobacteriota bacterium]